MDLCKATIRVSHCIIHGHVRLGFEVLEAFDEYDRRIQEEKVNQVHRESEKQRLKERNDAQWGDSIRRGEDAKARWNYWGGKSATLKQQTHLLTRR